MAKLLKRLPHSDRVKVWVYKDDPADADAVFEAIGQGHLTRQQQYAYMVQCTAKAHGVKLGVQ